MAVLAQIGAENFRALETLSLRPHRRLNLVYGDNAAGKTTLLELVYTLSRGKSFRGSSLQDCLGPESRQWRARARYSIDGQAPEVIDARWLAGSLEQQRNGVVTSRVELLRAYPVQILEPGLHKLLQEGPSYRRSFLDWGVFHVEHRFHGAWRRCSRALRQRNLALRQRAPAAQVQPWSVELAAAGEEIQAYRAEHLAAIRRRFGQLVERLLGISDWAIVLRSGWPEGQSLLAALDAHLARDRQLGQTQDGPQRAELRLRLQERQTKTLISRGQQKQLIAALLVSQCELIREATGVAPILLVDDFTAELGEDYQRRLLSVLQDYPGQLFITSFERSGLLAKADAGALFHVEQGRVKTLSG